MDFRRDVSLDDGDPIAKLSRNFSSAILTTIAGNDNLHGRISPHAQ
jgi:hypothetical protein